MSNGLRFDPDELPMRTSANRDTLTRPVPLRTEYLGTPGLLTNDLLTIIGPRLFC